MVPSCALHLQLDLCVAKAGKDFDTHKNRYRPKKSWPELFIFFIWETIVGCRNTVQNKFGRIFWGMGGGFYLTIIFIKLFFGQKSRRNQYTYYLDFVTFHLICPTKTYQIDI